MSVIALYPNLVPGDLRAQLSDRHPTKPPILSGEELEEGMKHLTKYLTQVRGRGRERERVSPLLCPRCDISKWRSCSIRIRWWRGKRLRTKSMQTPSRHCSS